MTRKNERIRAPKIRVVLPNGEQLGVMTPREAVAKAKSIGLDLVEIAPNADPPVCKIVDYGKWKYEQAKLKKSSRTKNASRLKELKFRVRTDTHDYNIKLARGEKFLSDGHKVRVQLQFRGRENAHREIGFEVMQKIKEDMITMAHVDQEPRLNGRAIVMVFSPLPEQQRKPRFTKFHVEDHEDPDDDHDDHDDLHDEDHDDLQDGEDDGDGGETKAPAEAPAEAEAPAAVDEPAEPAEAGESGEAGEEKAVAGGEGS